MVNQAHRTLGPGLQLQRCLISICENSGMDLIYSLPNAKSTPLMLRAGYRTVSNFIEYVTPLRFGSYLSKRINNNLARGALAFLLDTATRLKLTTLKLRAPTSKRTVVINTFDNRFDELWNRISSRYSMAGEKSSLFLNWRYRDHPLETFHAFCVTGQHDTQRLDGYVVFTSANKRVRITDFAYDSAFLKLSDLLLAFAIHQHRTGVDIISTSLASSPDVHQGFKAAGFYPRGTTNPLVIYTTQPSKIDLPALLQSSWYLVPGDNDT